MSGSSQTPNVSEDNVKRCWRKVYWATTSQIRALSAVTGTERLSNAENPDRRSLLPHGGSKPAGWQDKTAGQRADSALPMCDLEGDLIKALSTARCHTVGGVEVLKRQRTGWWRLTKRQYQQVLNAIPWQQGIEVINNLPW